jgi:hypothetical protein
MFVIQEKDVQVDIASNGDYESKPHCSAGVLEDGIDGSLDRGQATRNAFHFDSDRR